MYDKGIHIESAVEAVLAEHREKHQLFKTSRNYGEKQKILGFFMGMTFKKLEGNAKLWQVKKVLSAKLK